MNLFQFFKDDTGQFSAMRLCQVAIVLIVVLVFLITNILMVIQSLKAGRPLVLVDIPANALYAVGLAMGFKVVQTVFGEKNNGIPPSNN